MMTTKLKSRIGLFSAALLLLLAVSAVLRVTSAFHSNRHNYQQNRKPPRLQRERIIRRTIHQNRRFTLSKTSLFASNKDQSSLLPRKEATIRLTNSGRQATLISRTVPILEEFSITVWEWKNSAQVVNDYWEAQGALLGGIPATVPTRQKPLLDPFGLVSWPGSVLAARELYENSKFVLDQNVVVLGAGVGLETQAAAMLGATQVVATDIHPTTLQQLEFGVSKNPELASSSVRTQIVDLFQSKQDQPIPTPCDLLVVADVLYNEQLASQVCRRCAEVLEENPDVRILVTDSQRFVPEFIDELNQSLQAVYATLGKEVSPVQWKVETMKDFEGSGVIIDEDQTYDVTVQSLWVGL